MPRFNGFGPRALPFFKALAFHQTRDWFQENRGIYDEDVVAPLTALLEDLTERFAKDGIPLRGDAKSIFRINRDVRFARDKSPYKTHAGAVMTRSGGKMDPGLLYLHIAAEGSFVAAGFHMPDPAMLAAVRNAIKARPDEFQTLAGKLNKAKLALGTESQMTRLPKGFEAFKDSPLNEAIRLKSFIVEEKFNEADIHTAKLGTQAAAFAKRALPLLEFGWAALARG